MSKASYGIFCLKYSFIHAYLLNFLEKIDTGKPMSNEQITPEQNDLRSFPTETDNEMLLSKMEEQRNSLSTDRLDMSYGEILGMYERDELVIDPDFQRLFRWEMHQMSRFVESILLGIPVPPIFVAEDKDGKWELVDGLQRTSTLLSFFGILKNAPNEKNNWIMEAGELVPELEGYNNKTLPTKFLLNIKRASCRIEILRWNSNYDMRYELFNRLNTGGTSLTDQEIRNCIFRGVDASFNKLLEKVSKNKTLKDLVQPTKKQEQTLYLQELVLRFVSLLETDGVFKEAFIKEHMTSYMKKAVNDGFDENLEEQFLEVIDLLKNIGSTVFRFKGGGFSTSLFDAVTIGIARNIDVVKELSKEELQEKIEKLKVNPDFRSLTGSAASGKSRVLRRISHGVQHFS